MTDNRQPSGWRKRALLFLTSQCITLFGSTLVQMALVWYAAMETASGGPFALLSVKNFFLFKITPTTIKRTMVSSW